MDKELALTTLQLIELTLPTQYDFDESEEFNFDRLLEWLTAQVTFMIDRDFKQLMEALYRIDVPEQIVSEILNGNPSSISRNLARAILERQLKKAATRIKYKGW